MKVIVFSRVGFTDFTNARSGAATGTPTFSATYTSSVDFLTTSSFLPYALGPPGVLVSYNIEPVYTAAKVYTSMVTLVYKRAMTPPSGLAT